MFTVTWIVLMENGYKEIKEKEKGHFTRNGKF